MRTSIRVYLSLILVFFVLRAKCNEAYTFEGSSFDWEESTIDTPSLYKAQLTTDEKVNGKQSLEIIGGGGVANNGYQTSFASYRPTAISFWLKTTKGGSVISFTSNITTEKIQIQVGPSILNFNGYYYNLNSPQNQWNYFLLEFAPTTVAVNMNSQKILTYSTGPFDISKVFVYATQNTTTWLDDLYIGCPNGCSGSECNTNGSCTCKTTQCGTDCNIAFPTLSTTTLADQVFDNTGILYYSVDLSEFRDSGFDIIIEGDGAMAPVTTALTNSKDFCQSSASLRILPPNQPGYSICDFVAYSDDATLQLSITPGSFSEKFSVRLEKRVLKVNDGPRNFYMFASSASQFIVDIDEEATSWSVIVNNYNNPIIEIADYVEDASCIRTNAIISKISCSSDCNAGSEIVFSGTTKGKKIISIFSYYTRQYTIRVVASNCNKFCLEGVCWNGQCTCNDGFNGSQCEDAHATCELQDINAHGTYQTTGATSYQYYRIPINTETLKGIRFSNYFYYAVAPENVDCTAPPYTFGQYAIQIDGCTLASFLGEGKDFIVVGFATTNAVTYSALVDYENNVALSTNTRFAINATALNTTTLLLKGNWDIYVKKFGCATSSDYDYYGQNVVEIKNPSGVYGITNYYNGFTVAYPTCDDKCGGNGYCEGDDDDTCHCLGNFYGPNCESCSSVCNNGACNLAGGCTCDLGFGGSTCQCPITVVKSSDSFTQTGSQTFYVPLDSVKGTLTISDPSNMYFFDNSDVGVANCRSTSGYSSYAYREKTVTACDIQRIRNLGSDGLVLVTSNYPIAFEFGDLENGVTVGSNQGSTFAFDGTQVGEASIKFEVIVYENDCPTCAIYFSMDPCVSESNYNVSVPVPILLNNGSLLYAVEIENPQPGVYYLSTVMSNYYSITATMSNCDNPCSSNGFCLDDKCHCNEGYTGDNCEIVQCLNNCSDHGQCLGDKCVCESGWQADDCSCPISNSLDIGTTYTGTFNNETTLYYSIDISKTKRFQVKSSTSAMIYSGADCKTTGTSSGTLFQSPLCAGAINNIFNFALTSTAGAQYVLSFSEMHVDGVSDLIDGGTRTNLGASAVPRYHYFKLATRTNALIFSANSTSTNQLVVRLKKSECPTDDVYDIQAAAENVGTSTTNRYFIVVPNAEPGDYYFSVSGSGVYSTGVSTSYCDKSCSGNGVCYGGICTCFKGFTGLDCGESSCDNTALGNCGKDYGYGQCNNGMCSCNGDHRGGSCSCSKFDVDLIQSVDFDGTGLSPDQSSGYWSIPLEFYPGGFQVKIKGSSGVYVSEFGCPSSTGTRTQYHDKNRDLITVLSMDIDKICGYTTNVNKFPPQEFVLQLSLPIDGGSYYTNITQGERSLLSGVKKTIPKTTPTDGGLDWYVLYTKAIDFDLEVTLKPNTNDPVTLFVGSNGCQQSGSERFDILPGDATWSTTIRANYSVNYIGVSSLVPFDLKYTDGDMKKTGNSAVALNIFLSLFSVILMTMI